MRARISITQNFAKAFGLLDDTPSANESTASTPADNIQIQSTETHHASAIPQQDQPIFSVSSEPEPTPIKVNVQTIPTDEKLWVDEDVDHNLTYKELAQTYMIKYQQLRQVTEKVLSNLEDTQDDFLARQIEHLSSKMPYSQPIYVCSDERKAFADCIKHNSSNTLACKQFMDNFSSCTSKLRI